MLKKIAVAIGVVALIFLGVPADFRIEVDNRTIPEKIIETVAIVDTSSGIVVHSDENLTLVLSAFHVVADNILNGTTSSKVAFLTFDEDLQNRKIKIYNIYFLYVHPSYDLALMEIRPNKVLEYAKISKGEPRIGEDIFLGRNPGTSYRSLGKGIISSKDRVINGVVSWELTGGSIPGASGGGAFNTDGELFAIATMVEPFNTGSCWDENENDIYERDECVWVPVPFMGYYTPPKHIIEFLLNSIYAEHFKYLK